MSEPKEVDYDQERLLDMRAMHRIAAAITRQLEPVCAIEIAISNYADEDEEHRDLLWQWCVVQLGRAQAEFLAELIEG